MKRKYWLWITSFFFGVVLVGSFDDSISYIIIIASFYILISIYFIKEAGIKHSSTFIAVSLTVILPAFAIIETFTPLDFGLVDFVNKDIF